LHYQNRNSYAVVLLVYCHIHNYIIQIIDCWHAAPTFPPFFQMKIFTFFHTNKKALGQGGQSFIFFSPNLWVNYTQTSYLLYKKASICSFWCRNGRGEKICIFSYIFIIISSCKMICSFFSLFMWCNMVEIKLYYSSYFCY